jgi:hypothetical protein
MLLIYPNKPFPLLNNSPYADLARARIPALEVLIAKRIRFAARIMTLVFME